MLKTCSKCKVEKDVSMFRKNVTAKDGYQGVCKDCKTVWYNKICVECGKEFTTQRTLTTCCSNECQENHRKEYNKQYLIEHREDIYSQRKQHNIETGKIGLTEKNCIICGKLFMQVVGNQITCSKECHDIRVYQVSKEYHQTHKTEEIIKRDAEYSKKYREENKEYLKEQKKQYTEKNKEELARKAKIRRENNKEIKAIKDREYREANKEYLAQKSKEYRQSERGKEVHKINSRKRKAIIRGAKVQEIDYNWINERDGFKCQICKKAVNMKLEYPDPMCASYDHIYPISKGGEHSNANLSLVHLVCNVSKGAKVQHGVQPNLF